jgi:uncharacterized membrane protein YedE/YeeE
MTIDWLHFTPWASLGGGILIGLAAALLLLVNGKILGVSGIVGGVLHARANDTGWRLCFLLGMLLAPVMLSRLASLQVPPIATSSLVLAIAGLLVGFGTRLGSGCTSGHGICGVSRLSPRSLLATAIFILAGIATVFVVRHLNG